MYEENLTSALTSYYENQAGTGLNSFVGVRRQKGYGFWSRLFSNGIIPILKSAGKSLVSAAPAFYGSYKSSEGNIKQRLKAAAKSTLVPKAKETGALALDALSGFAKSELSRQKGSGRKRTKTQNTSKSKRKKTSEKLMFV